MFLLLAAAGVAMAMRIDIPWRMTWVVVVLPGHVFLAGGVAMTVLINVSRLVIWVIVMFVRIALGHVRLLRSGSNETRLPCCCSEV